MPDQFYIVPQHPARAWWEIGEEDHLTCSLCGAAADTKNLTVCPGCKARMTVDEEWTKKILERGYRKKQ